MLFLYVHMWMERGGYKNVWLIFDIASKSLLYFFEEFCKPLLKEVLTLNFFKSIKLYSIKDGLGIIRTTCLICDIKNIKLLCFLNMSNNLCNQKKKRLNY